MSIGENLKQIAEKKNDESANYIAEKLYKQVIDEAFNFAKSGFYSFELEKEKYKELYFSRLKNLIYSKLLELLKNENIYLKKDSAFKDDYVYTVNY